MGRAKKHLRRNMKPVLRSTPLDNLLFGKCPNMWAHCPCHYVYASQLLFSNYCGNPWSWPCVALCVTSLLQYYMRPCFLCHFMPTLMWEISSALIISCWWMSDCLQVPYSLPSVPFSVSPHMIILVNSNVSCPVVTLHTFLSLWPPVPGPLFVMAIHPGSPRAHQSHPLLPSHPLPQTSLKELVAGCCH